jgi:alkylated DNA repair dioxygenase AlkB
MPPGTDDPLDRAPAAAARRIELADGAYCELFPRWLSEGESRASYAALLVEVPFAQRAIRVFGREVLQPRLVAWVGEPDAVYRYSGTTHVPEPFGPALRALRDRVARVAGERFNSVLCNLYRDGNDAMGMHSDREPELGPEPLIASLSLGAPRRFQLRHRKGKGHAPLDLVLEDGSLLIMRGPIQQHYRHGVPREPAVSEPRINLTFRRIYPARGAPQAGSRGPTAAAR